MTVLLCKAMQSADMLHQGREMSWQPTIVWPAPHWARGTGVIFARTRPRIRTNSAQTDLATRTQESSGQDLSFLLQFTFVILRSEGKGEYYIPHDITDWIRWKSFTFQRKIWNVNSPDSISIYLEKAPPRRSENYSRFLFMNIEHWQFIICTHSY